MYPSPERPAFGTFVRTQVESLRRIGVDAQPFVLEGRSRKLMYAHAVGALRRRLRDEPEIQVVHAHYGFVGAVARTQWRVPVVVTFHGDDLLGTVGRDGRTTRVSRLVRAGSERLARHVDAVIVQSREMADRLAGVDGVHVIPHEVDLDLFRPQDRTDARAELGLDEDRRYVLFAASPDIPVKRFSLAWDAVARIRREWADVELLVVHAEPQVRLPLYLNACDALVLTSYQEGSPNVVKQAMACNLPVVATDVGDVAEIVGHTSGCAVVEGDVLAVAGALAEILAEPGRTDGRSRVAHLGCEAVAARVLDVYESITDTRRAPTTSGRA
jgi:glycosyltransferase involved in cell wall biosynthesis